MLAALIFTTCAIPKNRILKDRILNDGKFLNDGILNRRVMNKRQLSSQVMITSLSNHNLALTWLYVPLQKHSAAFNLRTTVSRIFQPGFSRPFSDRCSIHKIIGFLISVVEKLKCFHYHETNSKKEGT